MRALIVDDDSANRFIIEQFLKPFGTTDTAANGEEGLQKFIEGLVNHQPYDLVCLDIMMPVMNGVELLRRIRSEEADRGIFGLDGVKVIMTTAVADKDTVIGAFRDGCEAYLIKPLNRDDLIRNLKTLKLIVDPALSS